MKFVKMHGLGNSYVFVDLVQGDGQERDWPSLARRVSDPRFGVGSDGLILIIPGKRADFGMRIWNADGSEAEMCGNGIRCLGKYVYDHHLTAKTGLMVETAAGTRGLELDVREDKVAGVRVDMGPPRLERSRIPMAGDPRDADALGETLELAGTDCERDLPQMPPAGHVGDGPSRYKIHPVSMGNPHCVIFVDDTRGFPVAQVGPLIERHALFPNRANVEFVEPLGRETIRMRVWERGSGETAACGTGACASAVAAILAGLAESPVTVKLVGGDLEVSWAGGTSSVFMRGPAEEVFEGRFHPDWLRASGASEML
ncbi:MAG: diaminopimelate epimerase [Firmicutes bacterium]|nr:diaminopimelate epimerase [Bacillota bacterium]